MSRTHPECPDSDVSDRLVAADFLLRQEPEDDEEDDQDEDNGREEDDEDDDEGTDDGYSE